VQPGQRISAIGVQASRSALESAAMGDVRILHLATHGFVNGDYPDLSGIALSMVDERGGPIDGFFRLNHVYNLRLNADLVVLSACQTALGEQVRGEGLIGLTRGLMYAGAARVVASLWKVDDQATAALMTAFYRGMLGPRKLPAAAALREAQNVLRNNPRWQSPYYWAAFTLQGEWRPE
jgi:CHAT domain-containing protein